MRWLVVVLGVFTLAATPEAIGEETYRFWTDPPQESPHGGLLTSTFADDATDTLRVSRLPAVPSLRLSRQLTPESPPEDLYLSPAITPYDPPIQAAMPLVETVPVGKGCQKCGRSCCCGPCWSFFGEALYLAPRDAEIAYAIPIDGPIAAGDPRIPIGPTAIVDPSYQPGFRVGCGVPVDCRSRIVVSYTWYESTVSDAATIDVPDVLHPLVIHPSTENAATDVLSASAQLGIDFQFADIDFRGLWYLDECSRIEYLLGVRYAHLDQEFGAQFDFNGTTNVLSEVNFDGGGIRLGLDAERSFWGCLLVYARGTANFVAGDFQGRYFQGDTFDPTVVDMTWSSSRVVTILDAELGIGWQSRNCRFRATAGYVFNSWLNAVQPDEIIQAGQTNNFTGLGDGLSFDGFVGRIEYRF